MSRATTSRSTPLSSRSAAINWLLEKASPHALALIYLDASPRVQKVLIFIIVMPLLLSVVVRTFAWIVVLGREGGVDTLLMQLGLSSGPVRLLQSLVDRLQ